MQPRSTCSCTHNYLHASLHYCRYVSRDSTGLTLECRASLHYISRSISLCGVRGRFCGALSSSLHVCNCNACPKMLGSLYKVWIGNVLQSHQKLLETNTQVHARTHTRTTSTVHDSEWYSETPQARFTRSQQGVCYADRGWDSFPQLTRLTACIVATITSRAKSTCLQQQPSIDAGLTLKRAWNTNMSIP